MARPEKYGFSRLEVGQHVEVPIGKGNAVARRLGIAANVWGRKHGRRFSIRTLRAEGVARATRIE